MRYIKFEDIENAVRDLCLSAAYDLPDDVLNALQNSRSTETSDRGKMFLDQCIENAAIAATERLPICQDTGSAVYFVELGRDAQICGGTLYDAINSGTARGYQDGYLRKSIVNDPLFNRVNTGNNTPAVIHLELVLGDCLKITLAPKGGGSENMSRIKMLTPQAGVPGVINFVVNAVTEAGGNPCPPVIVGIGIGGTFEKVAYLAKKALLRKVGAPNPNPDYATLEEEILKKINSSQVGPQGLGGNSTALAVHIEYFPCHIASLPVAVNLNCHAARHASVTI
ncbi:MAG: fumarate hydratase [Victivallaceae bacterium]|nr:fumarate hydratase [Victivallaceae bacterium]